MSKIRRSDSNGGLKPPAKKPARRKPALNPATAPFKPGTQSFVERQRAATATKRAAHIAKIAGPPAPARTAQVQPKQVGSMFGLSDTGSLSGGTNKSPTTKNVPHLTAQVALAKARRERLLHGGLLTEPQREAETNAAKQVDTKTNFATPPPGRVALPQRSTPAPATTSAQPTPGKGGVAGKSGVIYHGTPLPTQTPFGSAGKWLGENVVAPAHEVADRAWATGLWNAASIPGTFLTPIRPGATHTPVEDVRAISSAEAASRLTRSRLKKPNVSLPVGWLNLEGTAYAGAPKGTRIPFDQLAETGFGLSPEGKAELSRLAVKVQHWNPGDIEDNSATDLTYKAYNPPPNLLERIGLGAANDVLLGGSQTVGALGLGSEVLQGRGVQAAKDVVHQLTGTVPVVGRHPFGQELETHPLFAATALHAGLKGFGAVGHLNPRVRGERIVTLPIHDRQMQVNRGRYSKNLYAAAGEHLGDVRLARSPKAARAMGKRIVDRAVQDIRDGIAPEHIALQVPYKAGMGNIRPARAEELMAHAAWGGTPGLEAGATHFDRLAKEEGSQHAASWAEFLRNTAEKTKTLSDQDKAYLDALHKISGHTSDVRQDLKLHGELAQRYRRYELPIEHSAALGDPLAIEAKTARNEYEDLRSGTPVEARHSAGVLAEVERQAKAAEDEYGKFERQASVGSADHAQWAIEGKKLRDQRPRLPKLEQPASTFATLKEASAAAKGVEGAKVSKTDEGFVVEGLPKAKHPPGTMGPHRKAVAEWKKQYAEWKTAEPKVSKGREHSASAKARSARSRADQLNARAESLRQGNPISHEDAVAAAEAHYSEATDAFIKAHLAKPGATEAAYIPYTKPPSGMRRVRRTAGKHRFTPKLDREHRSTGRTAFEGEFMLDPRAPLHANAEAQRLRANIGVFRELEASPYVKQIRSDGTAKVTEGMVAVPVTNMRSTVETMPAWDETPVQMHEYHEREHSVRNTIAEAFGRGKKNEGETIPKGDYFLIPQGMHDRIEEWAKPGTSQGKIGAFDRANQAYQRLLIGLYPSTWLGNAPGSTPLAFASGAVHPMDYVRSAQSGRQGVISNALGWEKHPERAPASIAGMGPAAGVTAGTSSNVVMSGARVVREASILGEDFSARAAYYGQARPYVEGQLPTLRKMIPALDKVMPEKWKGKAAELNISAGEVYQALASGKWEDGSRITPEMETARRQMLDRVEEFVGANGKPVGGLGKGIGRVVLFQSWIGHILKLSLVTLPITHPRRAVLLNAVALYGNQYRQEHGVYPGWMLQFFPLLRQTRTLNGHITPGTISAGVGQLTPIASAGNLAQAGSSLGTGNEGPITAAAGVVSPIWQPIVQGALQAEANSQAGPGAKTYNPFAVAFAAGVYGAPGLSKFFPRSGYDPTSNPLTGMNRRHYYEYVMNPSGKSYKRYEIPWNLRPGGRPQTGVLGTASRVGGLPLEWNPTGGVPFKIETSNAQVVNQVKATQREIKAARPTR